MRGPAIDPSFVTCPTMMTGRAAVLRDADEGGCDLAHLARMPGHALGHRRRHRLHRVDDEQLGPHLVDVPEDRREVGLGGDVELVVQRAGALGAQPHLGGRLLGAGVEHPPAGPRALRRDLEQQGRLADAGLAAEQDRRARHDAAAEHAVELADAGRATGRVGRVDRRDGPRGAAGARRDRGDRADDAGLLGCLDHGAPLLALAAAADPLEGRPPALGAPVRRGGRASGGHGLSVGEGRDIPAAASPRCGRQPGTRDSMRVDSASRFIAASPGRGVPRVHRSRAAARVAAAARHDRTLRAFRRGGRVPDGADLRRAAGGRRQGVRGLGCRRRATRRARTAAPDRRGGGLPIGGPGVRGNDDADVELRAAAPTARSSRSRRRTCRLASAPRITP